MFELKDYGRSQIVPFIFLKPIDMIANIINNLKFIELT